MRAGFRHGNEAQIIDQVSQKIEVRERTAQKAAQSRRPGVPTATMVIHNDRLHDGSPRNLGLEPARVLVPKLAHVCKSRSHANFGSQKNTSNLIVLVSCLNLWVRDSVVRFVRAHFRFNMLSSCS